MDRVGIGRICRATPKKADIILYAAAFNRAVLDANASELNTYMEQKIFVFCWKIPLRGTGEPLLAGMKLTFLLTEKLIAMGVEKPTARLVEEVEKLVGDKIAAVVEKAITPRLAARAFAATLNGAKKGGSGMGTHP